MTLPLLGLALGRRPPQSLVPLLTALYRWSVPATLDPTEAALSRPAAALVTVASAERVPSGIPLALWTRSVQEAGSAAGRQAAAIVSDDQAIVDEAGDRGVFAASGSHARGRRPMSPFVRQRLRQARGLPEVALLEQADGGWHWSGRGEPLAEDLVATAMASASAVVVVEPERLLEALAWGAPCVSDRDSAEQVGAVPETHLLVGQSAGERLELAARMAGDQELAARLSWAGRRLVERCHDAERAALRLAALLELRPALPEGALASARLQLNLFDTPGDATVAHRFAAAVGRLVEER